MHRPNRLAIVIGMNAVRATALATLAVACTPIAPGTTRPAPDPAGGATLSRALDPGRRSSLMLVEPAVEAYLRGEMREHRFPGMAVGLVAGGELVWASGLGVRDLATQEPVTSKTVFRIGSITKAFTGVAILQLRDAGKLSLDDPAETYVPEMAQLRYPTADSPRITIRHLVTHTAGIGMNTGVDYWRRANHVLTERELFATLRGFELIAVPGTRTKYSNIGVALAGLVVERVSGQRLRDYVRRNVLQPLGMTSTVWDREDVPAATLATGYRRLDSGERRSEFHWRMGAVEGMAGLYSHVEDMARFVAFELSAWPPRDGLDGGPLSRASVRESHMLAGHALPGRDRRTYGIAWRVRNDPDLGHVVSHVGGTFQYAASVWMLPERDIGIILLCNDGYALDKLDGITRNAMAIIAAHEAGDEAVPR